MRERSEQFRAQIQEKTASAQNDDERQRLEQEVLDEVLPEAFALVREAALRTLGLRHFDVQIMGGKVLHEGKIAEMKTGEGKTLVATLPTYLNALTGRGVHLVTVNDFLAMRDCGWMGPIYHLLGVSLGVLAHESSYVYDPEYTDTHKKDERLQHLRPITRREAYHCDITYGTNNEFGFDYLRDNMKFSLEEYVQRGHYYASILIDEARTPLIISGEVEHHTGQNYVTYRPYVEELVRHKQQQLVEDLLKQVRQMDDGNPDGLYERAEILLKMKYAAPKHEGVLRLMEDKHLRKAAQEIESNYNMDKKLSTVLDDSIYFTINEESKTAELNKLGREFMAGRHPKAFTTLLSHGESFHDQIYQVQNDPELSSMEKERHIQELEHQMEEGLSLEHDVNQLLKAFTMYEREVDYILKDNEVIIVDEFTGRMMPGRRWSDGLHQAIEAKEGVQVAKTNQTLATITLQNYFRMYQKLAGMTGTADTEAPEFNNIYKLDVVVLPTNRPLIRCNSPDVIYRTEREKFDAVVDEIEGLHEMGRPVLVGTISIEKSEQLSKLMKKRGVKHEVLNAKYHEREAEIISQAGRVGAVTIATNMAGRGTDIELGGKSPAFSDDPEFKKRRAAWEKEHQRVLNKDFQEKFLKEYNRKFSDHWRKEALNFKEISDIVCGVRGDKNTEVDLEINKLGGLHIIGTERHESRRVDDQLRGRSGRQGDPGSSRFYLSLEDDLMRIFGAERISNIMLRLGMEEGVPIEHNMVTKAIENAQKRVEAHNFDIRKRLLDYDDVMNKQREVVYGWRREVLESDDLKDEVLEMLEALTGDYVDTYATAGTHPEDWDYRGLEEILQRQVGVFVSAKELEQRELPREALQEEIHSLVLAAYQERETKLGEPMMRHLERLVMLQVIDNFWRDHLLAMDQLKEGIGLRGYGQKDPLIEYQKEGFGMFTQMMQEVKYEVVRHMFRMRTPEEEEELEQRRQQQVLAQLRQRAHTPERKTSPKVGRNAPCPCGSGKKYKKCCGK